MNIMEMKQQIKNSFLENVLSTLHNSIKIGGFAEEVYEVLSKPKRILIVSIPIKMDSGKIEFFEGYRVQHNDALGPYKGGIRFHPNVTLEDDIALAILMTLKNSLAGIPYGGAKGALRLDPKKLSNREIEEVSRAYVRAIAPLIGDQIDIPAPDVGTNSQIMAWMVDEFSKIKGYNVPGAFTAKPTELWGNPVREYSTGFGVAVVAREAAKFIFGNIEGKRVSIHGFGNVGQWTAYWLQKFGAKIVAVSDTSGTVYNKNGLNVEELIKIKNETGKVINAKNVNVTDSNESLYEDVDILIPASIENVIREDNVKMVNAKLIVEAANGPISRKAEEILNKKNIIVIPDILANAGGVIMSYLEWVENLQWIAWSEKKTLHKLESIMVKNFRKVYNVWNSKSGITFRDAAYIVAIERIYKAMKLRGWI